jgi:hypothetical protein
MENKESVKKKRYNRNDEVVKSELPERKNQPKVTLWNYITVGWLTKTMYAGAKRPIEREDLPELQDADKSAILVRLMLPFWDDLSSLRQKPSLFRIFRIHFGLVFLLALLFQALSVACILSMPTFIQQIIFYCNPLYPKAAMKIQSGIALAFILFALQICSSVFRQTSLQMFNSMQINVKTILIGSIYEKCLRLSQVSSKVMLSFNI